MLRENESVLFLVKHSSRLLIHIALHALVDVTLVELLLLLTPRIYLMALGVYWQLHQRNYQNQFNIRREKVCQKMAMYPWWKMGLCLMLNRQGVPVLMRTKRTSLLKLRKSLLMHDS